MIRKEKQITERSEIDEIINACVVVRVAMAQENIPYLVPLNFGYDGSHLYLHTACRGRKIDFFKANPRVCFEFERNVQILSHDTRACKWSCAFDCVIGNGEIFELRDTQQKVFGLQQIMRHYDDKEWSFDNAVVEKMKVWRIEILDLTGKRAHI